MKGNILIVEDERITAEDLQDQLQDSGYAVAAIASSGEEAVAQAEETNPDLVLMDIMLKGTMDGVDAAEQIHTRLDIPVVYLTANSDSRILERAKATEPSGYLLKPFRAKELHIAIDMALYKHRMERELQGIQKRFSEELGRLVAERTAQLQEVVEQLRSEIEVRRRTEKELLESEERFRQSFVQSDAAIILLDHPAYRVVDANPASETILGFTREELTHGNISIGTFVPPDEREPLENVFAVGRSRKSVRIPRMNFLKKDGTRIVISILVRWVSLKDRDVIHCEIRDVSEQIRLEEDARMMQARMVHANKMASLGMLVSTVAHEVNNPNTSIWLNTRLFSRIWRDATEILSAYQKKEGEFSLANIPFPKVKVLSGNLLKETLDSSRRISDIVQDLRNYYREDKESHSQLDIGKILRQTTSILGHQIRKSTNRFEMDIARNLPAVRGRGQQLQQVFTNLILNALQALPDKKSAVRVSASADPLSRAVRIRVADEGCGISEENLSKIMTPFFTTRYETGGTGLGLPISLSILEEHGGTLEIHSEPGKGTIVTVTLPQAEPKKEEKGSHG